MARDTGSRIGPQRIVQAVPTSELSPAWIIAGARLIPIVAVCIIVEALVLFWHIMPYYIALIFIMFPLALYFAVRRLSPERLLWLLSETICERRWTYFRSLLTLEDSCRLVDPLRIQPGDYICTAEEYEEYQLRRENDPNGWWSINQKQWQLLVIAKVVLTDSSQALIGRLGRGWIETSELNADEDDFFRYKTHGPRVKTSRASRTPDQVSAALDKLIFLLPDDGSNADETEAVQILMSDYGYTPPSVRAAVRIALTAALIERECRRGYVIELLGALTSRRDYSGHAHCALYLTESGRTWREAAHLEVSGDRQATGGMTVNTYQNFGVAGSMGEGNTVNNDVVNAGLVGINPKHLAHELKILHAELRERDTSPGQDVAVREVAAAQLEAERGDAADAMTRLARLGKVVPSGKWALETATAIGIPLAIAALKSVAGLPPGS